MEWFINLNTEQEDRCRWCHSLAQHICARILLASLKRILGFALMKNKCVSIDSKRSETHRMQKKFFYPFSPLRASRIAQSPSGVAQLDFNTINWT